MGAQALGERTDEQQDLGLGSAHRLGVERPDTGGVDGGFDVRLVVPERVDGEDAQDAVLAW